MPFLSGCPATRQLWPGFSFTPDRQRHSLPSLPGLGPRWFGLCGSQTKGLPSWPGAVGIGLAASKFPAGLLRSPCRGAVGTGLAALVAPQGPRTSRAHPEQQTRPSPRFKLLRAASIGEAAFLFPFCSRSPWRPRQKPLIAGIARNGAALYVFCVVSHANTAATRPAAYLPAGRHFFKEYPHAPR